MNITRQSSPEAKIALFKSLFCGRDDVFAQRFESQKTGRCGYSPACAHEWVRGLCGKPKIKCSNCPNRRFIKDKNEVIRDHLMGMTLTNCPFVMGIYPMLLDETCCFMAIDLDGLGWQLDAQALLDACAQLNLPQILERSRSGNGGHLWFFFQKPVPAILARKLGTALLTRAMNQRPEVGFKSYDRLFPNQDTLPKGGFGNLIALPLQGIARKSDNSLFLDASFKPLPDQWQFLSSIQCLYFDQVQSIVQNASRHGQIIGVHIVPDDENSSTPWALSPSRIPKRDLTGPLPEKISAILSDQIYIPKDELTPSLRNHLLRIAAFQNPEFYRAQAMRLPTYDKPRIIACAEDLPSHIALPRGCLGELKKFLRHVNIKIRVKDKRCTGQPLALTFQGKLRDDQQKAMSALLTKDFGVLAATTAFGKTVLAAAMIAERGVSTLILVHRRQLMEQWMEQLSEFLDLGKKEIGCLGGGRRKLKGNVDIALLQSVVRKGVVDDRIADYGHIIIDECHHVSAFNFERAVRRAKAKYILGLSATVARKDGHHPIIFMQCGPVRHRVKAREHAGTEQLIRQVIVRPTGFVFHSGSQEESLREEFSQVIDLLAHDIERNRMICNDVQAAVESGMYPLLLTERTEHLETLSTLLHQQGIEAIAIRGGMTKVRMHEALEKIKTPGNTLRTIVATGRFVGEGFDIPSLDALFITLPVSWKGTIAQYVGRLHRTQQGKKQVRVFDYADLNVPMLAKMFDRRCKAYRQQGYSILLPASAIPGWPTEVPLPIDEKWKQTYSADVQRLVRDGVDVPLAELFVQVTSIPSLDKKQGIDRARSASEAFLFRRLESLPEAKGRFILNARLNIPFCSHRSMEVDFLDSQSRVVIELDGSYHFTDLEAYRRDRRKDYLLQEKGYCVLRFLAEDLGSHLNEILDTILRALAHFKTV